MVGFRRFFFVLFLSFACIFLFIFLIRLSYNRTGFLGFNDLLSYFEGKDLYKPITNFRDTFKRLGDSVHELSKSINITTIFGGSSGSGGRGVDKEWYETLASYVGSLFSWVGNNIANLFRLLFTIISMPIFLIFDLVELFVTYLGLFIDFIAYIISFDGYTSSTLITT